MKRQISLIMLFVMMYSMLGSHVNYFIAKEILKMQIADTDDITNSHLFRKMTFRLFNGKITDEGFRHVEQNEFCYEGKMYDVIRQEQSGDHVTFYCVNDKYEDNMIRYLSASIEKKNGPGKKNIFISKNRIKKCITPDQRFSFDSRIISKIHTLPLTLTSAFLQRDIPPPKNS